MAKILYIADWHYGHEHIIAFDGRPFLSAEEMNQTLVDRWNSAVAPEDTVFCAGDMFWCNSKEAVSVLDKLNGSIYLVKGNHDRCNDSQFKKRFAGISEYMEIKDGGRDVVLCHYPIPCFKNHYYGWYHLYGHVHSSFEWNMMETVRRQMIELYDIPCNMYNVGAMMRYMEYTPRTLDEIVEGYGRT
ncbi:MAG: metallophosphoesterase family protein [Clostridia bacterium]|nr:metallophosphoesterase family protein [Clostridia bacterium]